MTHSPDKEPDMNAALLPSTPADLENGPSEDDMPDHLDVRNDLTSTKVAKLPLCDICNDGVQLAGYDAVINYLGRVTWAFVCEPHFIAHGGKLGLGRGQKLVLDTRR